jgi:hypothetical protein
VDGKEEAMRAHQYLIFADDTVLFDPEGVPLEGWSQPCRALSPDEIERYKQGETIAYKSRRLH